jgi:hypothetical protein
LIGSHVWFNCTQICKIHHQITFVSTYTNEEFKKWKLNYCSLFEEWTTNVYKTLKVNDEDRKPTNEDWNIQLHVFKTNSVLSLSYLTMFLGSYDIFLMFILNSDIWEAWHHGQHPLVHTLTPAKQVEFNHVQQRAIICSKKV